MDWFPTTSDLRQADISNKEYFTSLFFFELPVIMSAAMREAFGEDTSFRSVVPRIIVPTNFSVDSHPDIDVVASPNWTESRFERRDALLLSLADEIQATMGNLEGRFAGEMPRPQIDIDVDFVMGPGCALSSSGGINHQWPDQ